jgi:hypothetical protein
MFSRRITDVCGIKSVFDCILLCSRVEKQQVLWQKTCKQDIFFRRDEWKFA